MFLPHEVLPCSFSGMNLFCLSVVPMLVADVPPRAMYGAVGSSGVPNLRCVTPVAVRVLIKLVRINRLSRFFFETR